MGYVGFTAEVVLLVIEEMYYLIAYDEGNHAAENL